MNCSLLNSNSLDDDTNASAIINQTEYFMNVLTEYDMNSMYGKFNDADVNLQSLWNLKEDDLENLVHLTPTEKKYYYYAKKMRQKGIIS